MQVEIPSKRPGQTWMSYQFDVVNNLFLYFPLGREPFDLATYPDVGYYLGICLELGLADTPCGPGQKHENPEYDRSDLIASKTYRQFIREIWDVTASLGIDIPTLSRKLNQWYLAPNEAKRDETLDEEVCGLMIKIYIAMRERGYSKGDLVKQTFPPKGDNHNDSRFFIFTPSVHYCFWF